MELLKAYYAEEELNMQNVERAFYEEIRDSIETYSQYAADGIRGKTDIEHAEGRREMEALMKLNLSDKDLKHLQVVIEVAAKGVVHSLFVSIDGGTAISDGGKALELTDGRTGRPLTDGALHENFLDVF